MGDLLNGEPSAQAFNKTMLLSGKIKKFDVYVKTIDGVTKQTIIGAFISLAAAIVVILLILSEGKTYLQKDLVSRMTLDSSVGVEAIRVEFDINFRHITCSDLKFLHEVTRGTIHDDSPDQVSLTQVNFEAGCRIYGSFITDKVGGNFRFAVKQDSENSNNTMAKQLAALNLISAPELRIVDLSHTVNRLEFHTTAEEGMEERSKQFFSNNVQNSFVGQDTIVSHGSAVYHYALQVVPMQHIPLGVKGETPHVHQYTVTERDINVANAAQGFTISGQNFRGIVGLLFTYDFYPMVLVVQETKESLLEFLCSLCGIVGGVVVVIGMLDKCVYTSTKALIGKKD